MSTFFARLQQFWRRVGQRLKNATTTALSAPDRCMAMSMLGLGLLVRLYLLDAALIGSASLAYMETPARVLASGPWMTTSSRLLLGMLSGLSGSFTWTLITLVLLNSLSIAGLAYLASSWFGVRTGALAGLLLAFNPWAVVASRTIGAEALLIPAAVIVLWGLELALAKDKPGGWILALAASGLACGLAPIGAALALACLILCLALAKRVSWRHAAVGLLWGLLLFLPALYVLNALGPADGATTARASESLNALVNVLGGGSVLAVFIGDSPAALPAGLQTALQIWGWFSLAAIPLVGYLALWVWAHWKRRLDPAGFAAVALLGLVMVTVSLLLPAPPDSGSLVMALPAIALCAALLLDAIFPRLTFGAPARLNAGTLMLLVVVLVPAIRLYTTLTFFEQAASQPTVGGRGMPVRHWYQLRDMVQRCADQSTTDQVWILQSAEGDPSLTPGLIAALTPGVRLVVADIHTMPIALDDTTLILSASDRHTPSGDTATACGKVLLPAYDQAIWMDALATVDPSTLPIKSEAEALTMAPGITYLGYETRPTDAGTALTIYWRRAPDAETAPLTLYLGDAVLDEINPGTMAPLTCATMATTLIVPAQVPESVLSISGDAESGAPRLALDAILLTTPGP